MEIATKEELAIRPVYEWGHMCQVCLTMTIHRYLGPQMDEDGNVALHLWTCAQCGDTIAWESPEECGKRAFKIQTRRMRQRRSKRRYG